jgi:hypothetical protein
MLKPGLIPLRQGTGWLKTPPGPGHFEGHRAPMTIPRFRHALFAARLATLIGCGSQSRSGPNVLGRLKLSPRNKLHDIEPGALDANSPQGKELLDRGHRSVVLAAASRTPLRF